ncbi:undecaprenyl-diphosphatase UppP [soil metagenome]
MNLFHAIILAIVEGLSEFLPISSTGHMVLVSHVMGVANLEFVKSFEIIIQLGAIAAIVFVYWKTLSKNFEVWKKIMVAFLPTATIGFVLYKIIKHYFLGNIYLTLACLFIGGVLLIIIEKWYKQKNNITSIEDLSYKQAFIIGLFQSISVVPGVSRAAATIIGALFQGTNRKTAVEFSFLLAVPTMAAATGLDLVKSNFSFSSNEYFLIGVGLIISFFVALLAVKYFLKFVQTHSFAPFGWYRIIFSIFYFFFLK